MFAEHRRSERSKALAKLDLEIQLRLHFRTSRVAENTARAERAWAKLHAPAKPPHYFSAGEQLGRLSRQRQIGKSFRDTAHALEICRDFGIRVFRPKHRPTHRVAAVIVAGLVHDLVPDHERGAERATGVAGCGLDPNLFEGTFAHDAAVRGAVQRHAASQTKIRFARF